jgi:DNA-binding response OmpR family regulator
VLRAEGLGIGITGPRQSDCFRSLSAHVSLEAAAVSYSNTPGVGFAPTLVIDANSAAAEQLAKQLEHAGFVADTVDSCRGALTAARARHYGSMIFVGDLSLPNFECIAGLRRQVPRTWIIMICSPELPDTRELFLRYGVDALIVTPFSMEDLVSRLLAFSRRSRPP